MWTLYTPRDDTGNQSPNFGPKPLLSDAIGNCVDKYEAEAVTGSYGEHHRHEQRVNRQEGGAVACTEETVRQYVTTSS